MTLGTLVTFLTIKKQQYGQLHCGLWTENDGDSIRNSCDVSSCRINEVTFICSSSMSHFLRIFSINTHSICKIVSSAFFRNQNNCWSILCDKNICSKFCWISQELQILLRDHYRSSFFKLLRHIGTQDWGFPFH